METLKPCPCGQIPPELKYYGDNDSPKWATMVPTCCGEWMYEFRASYQDPASDGFMEDAIATWNDLPRKRHENA